MTTNNFTNDFLNIESKDNLNDNIKIKLLIDNRKPIILKGKKWETLKDIFTNNINEIGISDFNTFAFKYGYSEIDLNQKFDDIANSSDRKSSTITISSHPKINAPIYQTANKPISRINSIYPSQGQNCAPPPLPQLNINKVLPEEKHINILPEEEIDKPKINYNTNQGKLNHNTNKPHLNYNTDQGKLNYNTNQAQLNYYNNPLELINNNNRRKLNYGNNPSCFQKYKCYIITGIIILIIIAVIIISKLLTSKSIECEEGYFLENEDDTQCTKCSVRGCKYCSGQYSNNKCSECKSDLLTIKKDGEIQFCKDKDSVFGNICGEGYYFINDGNARCEKCSVDSCIKCEGDSNGDQCLDCGDLITINRDGKIIKCLECDTNGYFVPDDTLTCEQCTIEGCNKCKGTTTDIECSDCGDLSPVKIGGKVKQCIYCDEGYFPPDETTSCQKCTIDGCEQCQGPIDDIECADCGFLKSVKVDGKIKQCINTCETGPEEMCKTCHTKKIECTSCNIGYKLVDGKCRPDFFIKAVYDIQSAGYCDLFNSNRLSSVVRLIVDGKDISPIVNRYEFEELKEYTVYIKLKMVTNLVTGEFFSKIPYLKSVIFSDFYEDSPKVPDIGFHSLFRECTNLVSVDFSKISYTYSNTLHFYYIFYGCTKLTNVNLNFKNEVALSNAFQMFEGCSSLTSVDLSKLDTTKVYSFYSSFKDCESLVSLDLSMFSVDKVTNFEKMFYNCFSLESINLYDWRLSSATVTRSMFSNCTSLEYLDLSSFRPPDLTFIGNMFYNCKSLTSIDLYGFYTTKVNNLDYLFYNCASLKSIDLSSFNTQAVTSMKGIFQLCTSLTSINFGNNFKTSAVVYFDYFFSDCYSLTSINLESFTITKFSRLSYMFHNCYNLKSVDISNFKFTGGSGKYISHMFSGCYSLTSVNFVNEKIKFYTSYEGLFYDCPNLKYLNFSFADKGSFGYSIFNANISATGEIILDSELYKENKINVPSEWIVTQK